MGTPESKKQEKLLRPGRCRALACADRESLRRCLKMRDTSSAACRPVRPWQLSSESSSVFCVAVARGTGRWATLLWDCNTSWRWGLELQCVCRVCSGAKTATDGLFAGPVVAVQSRSKSEPSACITGSAQPYSVPDGLTLIASRMTPATIAPRLPRLECGWPAAHHFTSTRVAACTVDASHLSPTAVCLPRAGTSFSSHAERRHKLGPRALCITCPVLIAA